LGRGFYSIFRFTNSSLVAITVRTLRTIFFFSSAKTFSSLLAAIVSGTIASFLILDLISEGSILENTVSNISKSLPIIRKAIELMILISGRVRR
jgi:hypothetical protein